MSDGPDHPAPRLGANELHAPLARLLRPLVRLAIRSGLTFPVLSDVLRELYVNVAEHDFALKAKEQTDSRVSLLTGIHRKEVHRLRGAGTPVSTVPASASLAAQILTRWLSTPGYAAPPGTPLPLPRSSEAPNSPSFEALVDGVTRDLRPRAVLDDWLTRGLVVTGEDGLIHLQTTAYVPSDDAEALGYYFGRNLHDHIAAAAANVSEPKPRFLERAVHYDGLSEAQAEALEALSRDIALKALNEANQAAAANVAPTAEGPWRWNFGIYIFREKREEKE